MAERNKVLSYVGFAVKARKLVYGANLIGQYKKRIYLLLLAASAAPNTAAEAERLARRTGVDTVVFETVELEDAVNKRNCKLAAVTDENLAKAIREHAGECGFGLREGGQANG